jgi:hypothetical protein
MGAGRGRAAAEPARGAGAERSQRLAHLGRELERLRGRLAAAQALLRPLLAVGATRPLTADETRSVARLRLELEALRLELAALRTRSEQVRRGGAGAR